MGLQPVGCESGLWRRARGGREARSRYLYQMSSDQCAMLLACMRRVDVGRSGSLIPPSYPLCGIGFFGVFVAYAIAGIQIKLSQPISVIMLLNLLSLFVAIVFTWWGFQPTIAARLYDKSATNRSWENFVSNRTSSGQCGSMMYVKRSSVQRCIAIDGDPQRLMYRVLSSMHRHDAVYGAAERTIQDAVCVHGPAPSEGMLGKQFVPMLHEVFVIPVIVIIFGGTAYAFYQLGAWSACALVVVSSVLMLSGVVYEGFMGRMYKKCTVLLFVPLQLTDDGKSREVVHSRYASRSWRWTARGWERSTVANTELVPGPEWIVFHCKYSAIKKVDYDAESLGA